MKGRRYRVVNPVRFFIFVLICVFTITFAGFALFDNSNADAASVNTYKQVTVEDNGTLWAIAEEYCIPTMDVRDFIDEICEVNDISSNDFLQTGDVIFVPLYS